MLALWRPLALPNHPLKPSMGVPGMPRCAKRQIQSTSVHVAPQRTGTCPPCCSTNHAACGTLAHNTTHTAPPQWSCRTQETGALPSTPRCRGSSFMSIPAPLPHLVAAKLPHTEKATSTPYTGLYGSSLPHYAGLHGSSFVSSTPAAPRGGAHAHSTSNLHPLHGVVRLLLGVQHLLHHHVLHAELALGVLGAHLLGLELLQLRRVVRLGQHVVPPCLHHARALL